MASCMGETQRRVREILERHDSLFRTSYRLEWKPGSGVTVYLTGTIPIAALADIVERAQDNMLPFMVWVKDCLVRG